MMEILLTIVKKGKVECNGLRQVIHMKENLKKEI
jgi:hypothetical protein